MNPLLPLIEISIEEKDSPQLDVGEEDSGRRGPSSETDADFEEWWIAYPKKDDKAKKAK